MARNIEDRLRATYDASAALVDPDRIPDPSAVPARLVTRHERRSPGRHWFAPALAAAAVVVVTGLTFTLAHSASSPTDQHAGSAPTAPATVSGSAPTPSPTLSSPQPSEPWNRTPPARPQIGVAYPYQAYTHCGTFDIGKFDGRYWIAAPPIPAVPQPRPNANGTTTDNGYTSGTLTLVNPMTLWFAVDDTTVLTPGVTVTYHPAAATSPSVSGVCA